MSSRVPPAHPMVVRAQAGCCCLDSGFGLEVSDLFIVDQPGDREGRQDEYSGCQEVGSPDVDHIGEDAADGRSDGDCPKCHDSGVGRHPAP